MYCVLYESGITELREDIPENSNMIDYAVVDENFSFKPGITYAIAGGKLNEYETPINTNSISPIDELLSVLDLI